jgi:hypothetical protein
MAQRLARGAHNSEVTRSKRVAGIFHFTCFTEAGRGADPPLNLLPLKDGLQTGMAQRKRAGLITPRS